MNLSQSRIIYLIWTNPFGELGSPKLHGLVQRQADTLQEESILLASPVSHVVCLT